MIITLFLFPLLSSIFIGLFGNNLGIKYSKLFCIIMLIITTLISYYIYYDILINNYIYTLDCGKWLDIDYITTNYTLQVDFLTATMLLPIITISLLVNIYAYHYMADDPHPQRFFSYLNLFTSFMILLVLGNNYLILFIGWEYIGLASFLLIGYWYTSISSVKSSLSAFLINKIGDWFFLIFIILFYNYYGSVNYDLIYSISHLINTDINSIIMICIILACSAKSAQFGLHTWLIWAMAGPTPVSVLLHAATLVISGIYVLLRSTPILEYCPTILVLLLWLGTITTFVAGLFAIYTNDIKRIIALSTLSQLGMMIIAISISVYNISLYHLLCHSIYKALLFMSAGSIIHSVLSENQDIRYYGINVNYLPFTYICIFIASLSLMATPFMTGYYSKDIIIESMIGDYKINSYACYWLALMSALFTTIYSFKLIYYVFFNTPNMAKYNYNFIHETKGFYLPMFILAIMAIIIGFLFKDIYLGIGNNIKGIYIYPNNLTLIDTEFGINMIYKFLPLMSVILGIILTLYIYEYKYNSLYIYNNKLLHSLYTFFNTRLLYDQILNNIIFRNLLNISNSIIINIEYGLIYLLGPYGLWYLFNKISNYLISMTSKFLVNYTIYLLIFILLIIAPIW